MGGGAVSWGRVSWAGLGAGTTGKETETSCGQETDFGNKTETTPETPLQLRKVGPHTQPRGRMSMEPGMWGFCKCPWSLHTWWA